MSHSSASHKLRHKPYVRLPVVQHRVPAEGFRSLSQWGPQSHMAAWPRRVCSEVVHLTIPDLCGKIAVWGRLPSLRVRSFFLAQRWAHLFIVNFSLGRPPGAAGRREDDVAGPEARHGVRDGDGHVALGPAVGAAAAAELREARAAGRRWQAEAALEPRAEGEPPVVRRGAGSRGRTRGGRGRSRAYVRTKTHDTSILTKATIQGVRGARSKN